MALRTDRTAYLPFVLFALFIGVIGYAIVKGSSKKLTKEEIDEIYKRTGYND